MQKAISCSGCKSTLQKRLLRPNRLHSCSGCGHHVSRAYSQKEQSMIRDRSLRMMLRRFHKLDTT